MYRFSELARMCNGRLASLHEDTPVEHLLIDSRKVLAPAVSLFLAIKGERQDGHDFIRDAYRKGIRSFLVQEETNLAAYSDVNVITVPDTVAALHRLTTAHRENFRIPVIGITGSNAKTIVKEWLSQMLQTDEFVVKSPRSYNSQLGVPLSVWAMQPTHTLGIFEAGISRPGEMALLEKIIRPTIGIFTNIGPAHDEGFSGREEKIREKLLLFQHTDTLLYCSDHEDLHKIIRQHHSGNTCCWSFHPKKAAIQVTVTHNLAGKTSIEVSYKAQKHTFEIPFTDKASVENALHCIAALLYLQKDPEKIQEGLAHLKPAGMRLNLVEGINRCLIIDDTYNNDLAGLKTALDFLRQHQQRNRYTVILSDVLETGMNEAALYKVVGDYIRDAQVDRFIGIGEALSRNKACFNGNALFFSSAADFHKHVDLQTFSDEVILVKGARAFKFESIVQQLQQKVHGTVLEVNLDAMVRNLHFFQSRLRPETKVMAMVKAFAYGSGSFEVAALLQYYRIDYLAVAYADEGVELRKNGIKVPIMVMNPSPDSFEKLLEYQLEPEIYTLSLLQAFCRFIHQKKASAVVHLKIDTGMHRLGVLPDQLPDILTELQKNPNVKIASVFSHLAAADDPAHDAFTRTQYERLLHVAKKLEKNLGYPVIKHLLNTAGIVRFPEYQLDMVRLGLGLYGIDSTETIQKELEVVSSLYSTISQVKELQAGDTIGYGRKGKADTDKKIGIVAIGYADGFDRRFSNGVGKMLVHGKLVPVIGNVCMDMTMVDLTGTTAKEGDRVEVFGENLPLTELAHTIGTIPYELFTHTSERVKRVFFSA